MSGIFDRTAAASPRRLGRGGPTDRIQRPRADAFLRAGRARRASAAFTLVELTVVILIIILLIGILLPAVARVRIQGMVNASLADINILARGIELWRDDNNDVYPPSDVNGNLRLMAALVTSGKPYGCDNLPTITKAGERLLADRFTQPYMYYRFDREVGMYQNDPPLAPMHRDASSDFNLYAQYWDSDRHRYFYWRTDYVIISPGPDGLYIRASGDPDRTDPGDQGPFDPATDDITNFLPQ